MKYIFISILFFLALMTHANATDINISGKVVASSCTVDVNTVSRSIELPKVKMRSLDTAGSAGDWVDFAIEVNECPVYLTETTVKFSGVPDVDDATAYKNTGTSKYTALQLAARTTIYGNGSSMRNPINASTHKSIFSLSARIYSPKGNATAGNFSSAVNLTFEYQ